MTKCFWDLIFSELVKALPIACMNEGTSGHIVSKIFSQDEIVLKTDEYPLGVAYHEETSVDFWKNIPDQIIKKRQIKSDLCFMNNCLSIDTAQD